MSNTPGDAGMNATTQKASSEVSARERSVGKAAAKQGTVLSGDTPAGCDELSLKRVCGTPWSELHTTYICMEQYVLSDDKITG